MMRAALLSTFAFALLACSQGGPTQASEAADDQTYSRAEIEAIVRAYILENPEIIEDALIELQTRARDREEQAIRNGIIARSAELTQDPRDPVVGSATPQLTIIEFFDYRCPYCQVTNEWVEDTLAEHGDRVRFVFKEFPVLGPQSVEASRAALAVWALSPERYAAFHTALLSASGPLTSQRIDRFATDLGIDAGAMRERMDADSIQTHLDDVRGLAREIGISGTPFFIVGDQVIPGADVEALELALAAGLEG